MSSGNPYPSFNSDIFNPIAFAVSNVSLTLDDASKTFLKLSGGNVTGLVNFNNSIAITGNISLNGNAIDLSYISGVTAGTATASKAMVLNNTLDLTGGNYLSFFAINGVNNISSPTINATANYQLNGVNVDLGSIAGVTAGAAAASKALVLDSSLNIANINSVSTTSLVLGGNTLTSTQSAYLTGITPGTASNSKALVVDSSRGIAALTALGIATSVTKPITVYNTGLASGANITMGFGKTNASNNAGEMAFTYNSTAGLSMISFGHFSAPNLLNVFSNGNVSIGNSTSGSKLDITGDINASGNYKIGGVTLDFSSLSYLSSITPGTAAASKALVLDASSNISGIGTLTATSIVGNVTGNITGTSITAVSGGSYVRVNPGGNTQILSNSASLGLEVQHIGSIVSNNNSPMFKVTSNYNSLGWGYINFSDPSNAGGYNSTATAIGALVPGGSGSVNDSAASKLRIWSYGEAFNLTAGAVGSNLNSNVPGFYMTSGNTQAGLFTIKPKSNIGFDINASVGAARLNLGDANGSDSGSAILALDSTLGNASLKRFRIGKAETANNSFSMVYNHVSDGSNANNLSFEAYGLSNTLVVRANGCVGVGTTTPQASLDVQATQTVTMGTSSNIYKYDVNTNAWSNLGLGPSSYSISARFSGAIKTPAVYSDSDRRLKKNISSLNMTMDNYNKFNPVMFQYIEPTIPGQYSVGLIAQDVIKICAELVNVTPNVKMTIIQDGDLEGYQYGVDYAKITVLNINIIKQLAARIVTLESSLVSANTSISTLTFNVSSLQSQLATANTKIADHETRLKKIESKLLINLL